ncbi:hypothetical protein ACUNV4_16925 [Granulosicoccus sp. 3-233]|uniref:hypothetical protein n=1 Tax=Granulosicoccus sp. 3-233 TaxID=3417969 RepID=UPI003D351E41
MIDEDLYQQAADELNTDKRRPHIWARACALASDDHDEARYLYTNLRVEELIAERAAAEASSPSMGAGELDPVDASLALEPLDFDEDSPESISTPSGMDQAPRPEVDALTLNSAASDELGDFEAVQSRNFEESFDVKPGSDAEGDEQAVDELELEDDFLDETINLTSELDGTAVFELDKADASDADDTLSDHGIDEQQTELSADEELEALLGGVYEAGAPVSTGADDNEAAMTADFSDVSGSHGVLDDDMAWLDDDLHTAENSVVQEASDDQPLQTVADDREDALTLEDFHDTDSVARELERQAAEITGQPGDVVAVGEQSLHDHESASDEEQLALVLDGDSTEGEPADSSDPTGLDSIFDSIEQDADEAVSRLSDEPASAQLDDTSEPISVPDDAQDSEIHAIDLGDIDEPGEDDTSASDTQVQEPIPAAAMSAAAAGAAALSDRTRPAPTGPDTVRVPDISAASLPADLPSSNEELLSRPELPLDLTGERSSGSPYSVLRRGAQAQAVKRGVSWSALFLTLPFLIYRHLFGTAVMYVIMSLILVAGLLISGMAWLDAGAAASVAIKASTIGFAILSFIGLLYLPFRHANQWREDKLEQRGFEQVALVRDRSPGKAITQARNAATLD